MSTLPNITPEIIKAYQDSLVGNASPATAKRKTASLNQFFGWAKESGKIVTNPLSKSTITDSDNVVINPYNVASSKKTNKKTWVTIGVTTTLVILIFLLTFKLKFPIPFTLNFAQEASIQTNQNNLSQNNSASPSGSLNTANTAVISAWNLYTKLKLTDTLGTPIVGPQTLGFKVYNTETGGTALYTSPTQNVSTDTNGSVLISLNDVPSDLFFQNNKLYLEPSIGSASGTLRIPVSTASTPSNLNGYLPADPNSGAGNETIPVIDANGVLTLASQSPAITAKQGNFLIQGQAVTIKTADGGDGDIEINPDGKGIAHFLFEGSKGNFLNAQGPNLTSGSLYYGMVPNNATGYDLIRLQSGSPKMTTKFSVDALGNTYIAGDLNVINDIATNGVDRLSSTGALKNITGYSQNSGNFTINQNVGDFASIIKKGSALSDVLNLTLDERGYPNSSYSTLTLNRFNGAREAAALHIDEGSAIFDGQVQLGRYGTNPDAVGQGALVFNSGDNLVYFWNGSAWVALGTGASTAFSNITSGTNTIASMVVGSGSSLSTSGTGTITATDLVCSGCVSNSELANSAITFAGDSGSSAISLGGTETISGSNGITTTQSGSTLTVAGVNATTSTIGVASFDSNFFSVTAGAVTILNDSLDFAQFKDTMTLDAATDIATAGFALSTSGTGALNFNSTGLVTIAGNTNLNGDNTIGNATTDGITFTGRVAQDSDLIPITATGNNDLGTSLLPWDDIYAVTLHQNGNLVCDASGTNCPVTSSSLYWNQALGALFPTNSSVDVLIGSDSTTSAKFSFTGVSSGTPTASIAGATANVATYLSGEGTLATTNMAPLNIGTSTTGGITIGTNSQTISIDSNDWDISTVGNMSGIGTIASNGDWTMTQTTPSIFLSDSTASEDDYSIDVNAGSFSISNSTDSRVELNFDGLGGIDIGDNTTTKTIDIGGVTVSAADTINIATEATAADVITIGNANASTTLGLTGGTSWNISTSGDIALNGGDITTSATTFNLLAGATTTLNIGPTGANGSMTFSGGSGDTGCTLNGVTGDLTCSGNILAQGTSAGFWSQTSGVLYPTNNSVDVLIGASATTSAKFAFTGVSAGTPTASISGTVTNSAIFIDGNGNISTTNRGNLVLGNSATYNTTGNVLLNPNGTGNVGIGTTAPTSPFDLKSIITSGVVSDLGIGSATVLTNTLTGLNIDLSTNLTVTNQSATGQAITLAGTTNTNTTGTNTYKGAYITGGAVTQNGVGGTLDWRGIDIMMPGTTATAGTLNTYGIKIDTGTITSTTLTNLLDLSSAGTSRFTLNQLGVISETIASATGNNHGITANSLTTGTGLSVSSNATALSSGGLLSLSKTGASGSTAFTGDIANIAHSQTFNGGVALDHTGNVLDISRAYTLTAAQTHTISGALLTINDSQTTNDASATFTWTADTAGITRNCTVTLGVCTDSGSVLSLAQSYASGTGSVFKLTNSGTGADIQKSGTTFTIDVGNTGTFKFRDGTNSLVEISDQGTTGRLAVSDALQVGSLTTVAYSRLGTVAAGHTGNITTSNDLMVSGDVELDGVLYLDGETITDLGGTTTITFAVDPTAVNSYNTLTNGSWLIENPAAGNPGIAALMVNQAKGGALIAASASGVVKFLVANNGDVTLGDNSGTDLTVGGGTGKIDAGTVDPPYTINGKKFATFLSGIIGVKEEVVGQANTNEYVPGVGYRYLVDFNSLPEGSDLWLFSKATDIKTNINKLVALLTPSDPTRVWYEVDKENKRLAIYSARPTTISYRLTGPRFDHESWSNTRSENSVAGFVLNIPDMINNNPITVNLQSMSDFTISKIQDGYYQVKDSGGKVVDGVESIGNFVAGNIKSGAIQTSEIATNSFTALQGTIDNLLVTAGLVTPNAKIALISPLPDTTDITFKIGSNATDSGKLAIQNNEGTEVASIDTHGNAKFAGDVHANNIDEIQSILNQVSTDQDFLSQIVNSNINTATNSANFTQLATGNLFVTGQAAINSLSVTNTIAIGSDLILNSADSSLNTLSLPLRIQSLALAPVEIMAGKVKISTNGDMSIDGSLTIAGVIKSRGLEIKDESENKVATINTTGDGEFKSLSTGAVVIAGAQTSTPSAAVNGQINSNSTVGQAIIPANTSEVTIHNPKVTDYTLVYVTPTSSSENKVLYIKSKGNGYFTLGFSEALPVDVSFNWWIVATSE